MMKDDTKTNAEKVMAEKEKMKQRYYVVSVIETFETRTEIQKYLEDNELAADENVMKGRILDIVEKTVVQIGN